MILGITGTNGAGKGSVVEYLVKEKGFAHYSVRDLIIEEVERRGLPLNRTNIGETATSMRAEFSPSYFVETFLKRANEEGKSDVIIESIRTLKEADHLKDHGAYLVGVDAPVEERYRRITARGTVTDHVSFEDFRAQEDAEYSPKDATDPSQMNVLGVLNRADYTLINDGTVEKLSDKIEEMLTHIASLHATHTREN
jgi:dephospho-CoA kinase